MKRPLWELERDLNLAIARVGLAQEEMKDNLIIVAYESLQQLCDLLVDIRDRGVRGAK